MNPIRSFAMIAGVVALATVASAQSFTLRVNPRYYDLNNLPPSYFPSNPESTTFTSGSSGIGTYVGIVDGAGFLSASATIDASILDANHGTLTYNDGINAVNAPPTSDFTFGNADPLAVSEYSRK